MDEDNIKDLLPQAITEALSEEKLEKLQAEFDRIVEAKVHDRIEIAKRCERTAFDEKSKANLERLVVQIDEAHKKLFAEAYKAITNDYEKQLSKIRSHYHNVVSKESDRFKKNLIESISTHITEQVNKLVPTKDIRKAVRNVSATQVLESLKTLLAVDEAAAMKTCREPFMESIKVMNKQGSQIKRLEESNRKLRDQVAESAKENFFAQKQKALHLSEGALNFVKKTLDGASLDYIKENFDYTLKHFRDAEMKEREALTKKTLLERRRRRSQVARAHLVESAQKAPKEEAPPMSPHESVAKNIIKSILK